MPSSYPTSNDTFNIPTATSPRNAPSLSAAYNLATSAITALETKLGTGSSTATANKVLRATGTGTTAYAQVVLTTDVTGTLPVANGGTGVTSLTLPAGTIVGTTDTQVLTNKDITSATNTFPTSLVTLTGTQTQTNKILTTPVIATFYQDAGLTKLLTAPAVTDTLAVLGTAQTFTATQTEKQINWTTNAITATANAATVPITSRLNVVTNNSAATLTITMTTTSAVDKQLSEVCILDATGAAQTVAWVNTENSQITAPTTSNGSTTLPLSVLFQYNSLTTKWRCIAVA
jgi:hypothetical protein